MAKKAEPKTKRTAKTTSKTATATKKKAASAQRGARKKAPALKSKPPLKDDKTTSKKKSSLALKSRKRASKKKTNVKTAHKSDAKKNSTAPKTTKKVKAKASKSPKTGKKKTPAMKKDKKAVKTKKQNQDAFAIKSKKELKRLVNLGKKQGYLTYEDINKNLDDMLSAEKIDNTLMMFDELNIKVVDGNKVDKSLMKRKVSEKKGEPTTAKTTDALFQDIAFVSNELEVMCLRALHAEWPSPLLSLIARRGAGPHVGF